MVKYLRARNEVQDSFAANEFLVHKQSCYIMFIWYCILLSLVFLCHQIN